jgi:predicted GIY-YIG superfamily endonuclease
MKPRRTFWVYMTVSGPFGHLYVGFTNDLLRRAPAGMTRPRLASPPSIR